MIVVETMYRDLIFYSNSSIDINIVITIMLLTYHVRHSRPFQPHRVPYPWHRPPGS